METKIVVNGPAAAAPGSLGPDFASAAANGNGNDTGNVNRSLVNALTNSKIYRDYARAFGDITGLPLALQPVETWQLPHHGARNESPFCALISRTSRACAACLQMQERLCAKAVREPQTLACAAGLCDTAVPVRMSDRLIGYLQSGQFFRKKPDGKQFEKMLQLVETWGLKVDREKLKEAYYATKVISPSQQKAAVKLLTIFSQHLAMMSNQVFIQQENAEPPVIKKARDYIQEHQGEKLSLGQVARAVNMSTFYFCKTFKKVTGINFTDYLSRVRIEKSKNLLLNPNLRVSEIAFEVGFQSLTHFNRVFKKILGQSPTEYRAQLLSH
jgi:AraC-like DNA-binding protein/ligand-binding sensor protein